MESLELNGARIFYEAYGTDRAGRAPILLIHGSTITAQRDWAAVAPELARRYRVYAPDCRGHGHSSNPAMSYSFRELADDAAGFIHAMGYERAHVIGHSNGGNVALVTLMEHPEAIETCIMQAANAYVTPFLVEREPRVLDPDYVARNNPTMMQEMIELHSATHGSGYWRDLLRMTVREIISEPNYTPSDLLQVSRPTFVIMGEDDPVNAPDRHAQYIAENIPAAELWIPDKTGHNVHFERREEWLARVLDFLERHSAG